MSVEDFIRTAASPPDWLQKAWTGAEQRGIAALSAEEIDAEIAVARREKNSASSDGTWSAPSATAVAVPPYLSRS
jgi:hypothetical protein